MNQFVLDASVAAKWLMPSAGEPLVENANRLLESEAAGECAFLVPDLFWPEIGNVIWKALQRKRISEAHAAESIAIAESWTFTSASARLLYKPALAISLRYERSFYDSVYAALAVAHQATFVTADERMARATAAYLPVKWLGAM